MEDKTQKERLEQELRFLKESFEAEVISKEEFEKGSDRIERKLKEIQNLEKVQIKEETKQVQENHESLEEQKKKQIKDEEAKTAKAEEPKKPISETKEQERIQLKIIQEEHGHFETSQVKAEEKEEVKETIAEPKPEIKEEKRKSKTLKYSIIFVVIALFVFFSYSIIKDKKEVQEKRKEMSFVAACSSDKDCNEEGKLGFCISPGTKDAKCEFKEVQKVNVVILNDRKNCFNCDTGRVLAILEEWFGLINSIEIDHSKEEGKSIANKFDAQLLPIYILDENITEKENFEKFKQVFVKKDNSYVLNEDAAGSTYYFKRNYVPNKLDLFMVQEDDASIRAEKNLQGFLQAFKDVKFEKHLANDKLTQELDIKAFPTFLVNNQVKFSGVHTAETIKENFCKMNKLKECEKSLSKNLI